MSLGRSPLVHKNTRTLFWHTRENSVLLGERELQRTELFFTKVTTGHHIQYSTEQLHSAVTRANSSNKTVGTQVRFRPLWAQRDGTDSTQPILSLLRSARPTSKGSRCNCIPLKHANENLWQSRPIAASENTAFEWRNYTWISLT